MSQTLFVALAGLPDDTLDQLNQVGWFLPILALILPVSLLLVVVIGKPSYFVLFVLQAAGLYFGFQTIIARLRRNGFTNFQVGVALAPLYLVGCFITNLLVLVGYGLIQKFIPRVG
ncbi:MAG: hypothetical protein ABJF10_27750 [Chthoniobacter sp.]|uniref:hypothetical protein n=1 Tax=Chthoniobacter sp. TaxID=2510640 RepID=UPI0032A2222C